MPFEGGHGAAITTVSEPGGVVVVVNQAPESTAPPPQQGAATDEVASPAAAATAADGRQKSVVKLYRHDCDGGSCQQRWSRQRNIDDENRELNKSVAQVPIIHRQQRRRGGKWETFNFTVQNREMRRVLARALVRYQEFDPALEDWTFSKPFQPLVHRWETLRELQAEVAAEAEAVQLANREARADGADAAEAAVQAGADQREREAVERRELVDELMAFLTPLLVSSIAARDQTIKTGKVEFLDVWQAFPPGELAVTKVYDVDVICRVAKYEKCMGRSQGGDPVKFWAIEAEYIDWNGEVCGWTSTCANIVEYEGFRAIDSLPIVPLRLHPDAEALKARMIARGRKFESLRGYHYRSYEGSKISLEEYLPDQQKPAAGRIVVDAFAYFCSTNRMKPSLSPLKPKEAVIKIEATNKAEDEDGSDTTSTSSSWSGSSFNTADDGKRGGARHANQGPPHRHGGPMPRGPPGARMPPNTVPPKHIMVGPPGMGPPPPHGFVSRPPPGQPYRGGPQGPAPHGPPMNFVVEGTDHTANLSLSQKAGRRAEDLTPLTDEECMFTTPWVRGFDMTAKDWALFSIDGIRDVIWNDDAFERLVLPSNSKELAWAFVENKALERDSFDDFVESKGRGLIILMFGPPGVGKTYTAEAVAERSRVPLYSMGAAVLGTNPRHVEYQLDRALQLCRLWKAMFLLDEADIFLSARNSKDLMRNELVAVFLTKLEYYQGTLFLTTNRISALDHAFQSRVDLLLPYHDLTPAARRQVWDNFVAHLGRDRFEVGEEDLDRLSEIPLNGREIKNLTKSACLLSAKGGERISADRLLGLARSRVRALELLAESDDGAAAVLV